MKTIERFDRAINALVTAFLQGTLAKGACHACAVGNICAASLNFKVKTGQGRLNPRFYWEAPYVGADWSNVFHTRIESGEQRLNINRYVGAAKEEIDATGYSLEQLMLIEKAFESNTHIIYERYRRYSQAEIDADQYAGLVAVFNTLCEIEGIADPAPYVALLDKSAALPA
jgi:hypothetical protein